MKYYSTKRKSPKVKFGEALERGIAPDGGLYMPDNFPVGLKIEGGNFADRASQLLRSFMPHHGLDKLCVDAFNFPVPLRRLSENLFVLELFHGPTLSFKDFGARFMARAMALWVSSGDDRKLNVIVATSGDTGSAVANAFFGVPGTNVFVLYPKGRVTDLQEKQMATLRGNIFALEVDGDFDDCQRIAKEALNDAALRRQFRLSSANSINPGRLLPQMPYYLEAAEKLRWKYGRAERPIFVVPSGNFGNLTAGLFAHRTGSLPVKFFVAAVNLNSRVPEYLATGTFGSVKTIPTLSNAMDVGLPSNLARIVDLFGGDRSQMNEAIKAVMVNGHNTEEAISETYKNFDYVIDPHTAVGMRAAAEIAKLRFFETPIIVLSTAHPAKFRESVEKVIGAPVEIPERLAAVAGKEKLSIGIEAKKDVLVKIIKAAQ